MPTVPEKKIFALFDNDYKRELTVKLISDKTGRDMTDLQIRESLNRLIEQNCVEYRVDNHNKSHALFYKLNTNLPNLKSLYKDELK
jgi:hypothetical protein